MSSLDIRWYPRNIIGGNLYDLLQMYAIEFASGSVETNRVLRDLYINTVRPDPIDDTSQTKMFDNFGSLVGINKIFAQDTITFNTGSILQSYRSALALYMRSYLWGSTERGLDLIGGALDGVAPIVISPQVVTHGWKLTTLYGKITATFPHYIVLDRELGRYGNIFYVGDESVFTVGNLAALSFSKLDYNTYLRGEKWFYAGDELYFFGASGSLTTSVRSLVETAVLAVEPARVKPRVNFLYDFVYYRPTESIGQIDDYLSVFDDRRYVYNVQSTPLYGSVYDTGVLELPSGYQSLDWWYDWLAFEINRGQVQVEIRTYPSASIPAAVPYYKYDPEIVPLLDRNAATAHWLFNKSGSIVPNTVPATYGKNHLTGSVEQSYGLARDERRLGFRSNGFNYSIPAASQSGLDPTGSFGWEIWLAGVDNTYVGSNLVFGRVGAQRGWSVTFDRANQNLLFSVKSGSVVTAITGSLAADFAANGEYWHRWAGVFSNADGFYLYEDEKLLAQLPVTVTLPTIAEASNPATFDMTGGSSLLVDELVIRNGEVMSLAENYRRWDETRPHIFRVGIPSQSVERYHQARIRMFASGSEETQFHQFSIRGIRDLALIGYAGMGNEPLQRYPIFPVTGGQVYGGIIYVVSPVTVSESVTIQFNPLLISVNDSVAVAENVFLTYQELVDVNDAITVAEDVVMSMPLTVQVSDDVTIVDDPFMLIP